RGVPGVPSARLSRRGGQDPRGRLELRGEQRAHRLGKTEVSMLGRRCAVILGLLACAAAAGEARAQAQAPLRIISFGAHPDDCELKSPGVGAKWAALGHKFKCVAVTNGDI